ncbi:hypothetical protein RN001_009524 [Aquatica leii]|uniref:Uncharacterized protein n=1 Tax=Aquatica leii TaxID=1421715 RepID=A0AAN7SMY6_9COLE|nr:hypothetical protein RN001_009524 [Aquatica leii]
MDDYFQLLKKKLDELELHDKPSQVWNLYETNFNFPEINPVASASRTPLQEPESQTSTVVSTCSFEELLLTTVKQNKPIEKKLREKKKNFISHIGGNSPKDNTNRILKRIFTNKCAMECSYMGHRNNFRVSTLPTHYKICERSCMLFIHST